MNINFSQSSGKITDDNGKLIATGWAGHGLGKNNPDWENVHDVGPLPKGLYRVGAWGDHPPLGPNSAPLTQVAGGTYGRSGMYIHGPGTTDYGQESKGCIVVPHDERLRIITLNPNTVTVTA